MLNISKHTYTSVAPLAALIAASALPRVALASVGAGAGLPYEDTFAKIVTSLTGPWAWTVAIVCVIIFCWRAVERGGDLGGSTMTFLGPAFICTLLLGAKKLMTFFGQGATLADGGATRTLWLAFGAGMLAGLLLCGWSVLSFFRSYRRQVTKLQPRPAPAGSQAVAPEDAARPHRFELRIGEVWHTMFIGSTRAGKSVLIPFGTRRPHASDMQAWPKSEPSSES